MWRRILQWARRPPAAAVSVPPSGAANVTPTSATTIPAVDVQRIPLNTIDSSKQIAHAALRDAIKELSEGTSRTITLPPVQELNSWKSDDLSALSLEQLELLARAHYEGKGNEFEKNPEEAVRLWREASNRGSLEARYSLAVCHRDGVGVEKNAVEAYGILKELADNKNYNLAHFAVAIMLSNGDGIPQDDAAAFKHLKAAAKGGVMPALHNIANFYAAGRGGVKQSDHNAMLYYEAAVQAGDPSAKFTLGCWLYTGRGGKGVDKVRSFQLQFEAAQAGHPAAMFNVGAAYMAGEGVVADVTKAVDWFDKASYQIPQAAINIGNMYRTGHMGTQKDLLRAQAYFKRHAHRDGICKALLDEVEKEISSNQS